jgi:hypothetical protein
MKGKYQLLITETALVNIQKLRMVSAGTDEVAK